MLYRAAPTEAHDPWRRLAAAVLLQAARDAKRGRWPKRDGPGNPAEAREWLASPMARELADYLGLAGSLERWLSAARGRGSQNL